MTDSLLHGLELLFFLIGVPFGLALLLQWIGGGIRESGVSRLGKDDWYLVAPGVACNETGHAVGCLLAFCRITKYALSGMTVRLDMCSTRQGANCRVLWPALS